MAVRTTLGSTRVCVHYMVSIESTFGVCVAAAIEAMVASHRMLWESGTSRTGEAVWLQDMHFTSAAELVLRAAPRLLECGSIQYGRTQQRRVLRLMRRESARNAARPCRMLSNQWNW
jgi:hypothetical protein